MAATKPAAYLSTMTRGAGTFAAGDAFLYTELTGAWLFFAFVEAVVLRVYDDLALWRLLCAGMLLSDAAYVHSAAQAVGGWSAWATLAEWTTDDWIVLATTAPPVLVRILIVLGIGIRRQQAERSCGNSRAEQPHVGIPARRSHPLYRYSVSSPGVRNWAWIRARC